VTSVCEPSGPHVTLRRRLEISGVVQGVGFRPFVHRLATELGLAGWVRNTAKGVTIEIEGGADDIAAFERRLYSDAPVHAVLTRRETATARPTGARGFDIRESEGGDSDAPVIPDLATCAECLSEVLNPLDRRHAYPFTNCTNCGPRYSIIESLPYDRARTTMRRFAMCSACAREYHDPADRRFHAQPNACPACGPQLELWTCSGRVAARRHDALLAAAMAIRDGGIVAVKGLGGFHLIVDAANDTAVERLRFRKHRDEKPLAIMFESLTSVEAACAPSTLECALLTSPQAPIVLLRRRASGAMRHVSAAVAPRNPYIGALLPYTPLHHLLIRAIGRPVVATSGNLSDEPICTDEHEAVDRLESIADLLLVHNRPIARHVDDSVVRAVAGRVLVLRSARGYAPLSVDVEPDGPALLAVGAQQKNVLAVAKGNRAFLSQYIGDIGTPAACAAFRRTDSALRELFNVRPRMVACDLHPDYYSTRFARGRGIGVCAVQHHHAHVAACMVEHGLEGPVLGVSWDGTGYGPDGTVWGGEFLECTLARYARRAHLRTFLLPGGDLAATQPRRSALGLMYDVFRDGVTRLRDVAPIRSWSEGELRVMITALSRRINCPRTSSAGRLFDAVAAVAGLRQTTRHEGQAAMELEFAAEGASMGAAYDFRVIGDRAADPPYGSSASPEGPAGLWIVDWAPMLRQILDDLRGGVAAGVIARKFHDTCGCIIVDVARRVGLKDVVLTGGCFQNRLLTELTIDLLRAEGFTPHWHRLVPPNDGGIALGQLAVARRRWKEHASCA